MAIEFSSKSAQYSEFSNFHASPFTLKDKKWPTVEHYFQAQKFPGDPEFQEKIRLALTPASAKKMGRTRSPHFRSDWEAVKEDIMREALQAKFRQNPALATLLHSTGTAPLKEKAFWDNFWGTGRTGNGKNRMGILLEQLREQMIHIT
jgi:N-glycosidase YbiA